MAHAALLKEMRALIDRQIAGQIPKQRPKSFRHRLFEWLFGGGALLAFGTMAFSYLTDDQRTGTNARTEICKLAYLSVHDESLNADMTQEQRRAFMANQLQIVARCDREVGL